MGCYTYHRSKPTIILKKMKDVVKTHMASIKGETKNSFTSVVGTEDSNVVEPQSFINLDYIRNTLRVVLSCTLFKYTMANLSWLAKVEKKKYQT